MLTLESARDWYSRDDSVHGYDHIERVYYLAERLAEQEGADCDIVRAAVLLHDAHGDNRKKRKKQRMNHQDEAAEFAQLTLQADGWRAERIEAVIHCIQAHRFRDESVQPQTLEAKVVFDADKLDAIGAIGVARAIGYAITHNQPVFAIPSEKFMRCGELAEGEPHSAYHEYIFKLRHLIERLYTKSAKEVAAQRHSFMQTFFEHLWEEYQGKE